MTKEEFEQEQYEEVLALHWHKLAQIKELVDTNTSNHPLRIKSIADRRQELLRIENQKLVLEQINYGVLVEPDWYKERIAKYG